MKVPPLGFDLCGLRMRLLYEPSGVALDRQPIVRSHADVAPILARLFEPMHTDLIAGLVNTHQRLFAVARIESQAGNACDVAAPGAIYRAVIASRALAVYLAHRHEGSVPEVSTDDLVSAARVYTLGFALGLELRDSLIFAADERYISLREWGEGAEDWRRARERHEPDYPLQRMRLHQAGANRRPERPGSTRSQGARAALWRCAACHRQQNYKHACRYCDAPRPS